MGDKRKTFKKYLTRCDKCFRPIYRRKEESFLGKNGNTYHTEIGRLCIDCYNTYQKRMNGKELCIERYRKKLKKLIPELEVK